MQTLVNSAGLTDDIIPKLMVSELYFVLHTNPRNTTYLHNK